MKKSLIKKIILVTVCIISCFGLTGCGSGLKDFAQSTLPQAIRDRGEANKQTAALFYSIGAISESQYIKMCEHIDKQVKKYAPEAKNGEIDDNTSKKILGTVSGAVSKLHLSTPNNQTPSYVVGYDDNETPIQFDGMPYDTWNYYYDYKVNSDGTLSWGGGTNPAWAKVKSNTSDGWKTKPGDSDMILTNFVMSNYLAFKTFGGTYGSDEWIDIPDNKIEPIELVSEDVSEDINKAIKAKLYVLNSDMITTNDLNALDSLIANIQQTINSNDKPKQKAAELNAYFIEARDESNEPIYLIDPDDDSYDMVQVSKANGGSYNEPGYDLIIGQYDMEDCLHVRFMEFNTAALDKLNEFIGQNIKKIFLLQDGEGEWRAYLMAYPIETIKSMTLCEEKSEWASNDWAKDDGGYSTVGVEFEKSGLGVNLMTGQFIKYKRVGNSWDYSDGELLDLTTDQLYLTLTPAQNNDANALCSLVVNGIAEHTIENTKGTKFKFYCGRIILRDYLEATYAPGYDSGNPNEVLAVFGRKIRLNVSNENFKEDKSKVYKTSKGDVYQTILVYERGVPMASFVDKNGEEVPGSPTLEITDFCDAGKLSNINPSSCTVARFPYKNEEYNTQSRTVESDVPDITELTVTNEDKTIRPVTWFPSSDIGKKDYNTDTNKKQRFYCIATTKGIFGSALYSSWIESTVPDANLDWWNEYLTENGFSYKMSHVDIAQYLTDNYRYQLSQNGVVILDLETIETIQEMYDDEANQKRVGAIRTAFVIIGWVLVVGSFLLLLLWVIDTNTDVGLGLLEKVTFGNWVAVRYEEDIPAHNVNDQKYMTFKRIMIRVMIIIAIGILLIRIDVFYILTIIVDMFGQLASQVEKIIKGRM